MSDDTVKDMLKDAETRMNGAVHALELDLSAVRTGRASPALVERLHVDYYGTPTHLMQLASISVPEPRSIMIKPFDAASVKNIEKAIDNLGRDKVLGIVFNGYEQVRKSYYRYYDRYYKGK